MKNLVGVITIGLAALTLALPAQAQTQGQISGHLYLGKPSDDGSKPKPFSGYAELYFCPADGSPELMIKFQRGSSDGSFTAKSDNKSLAIQGGLLVKVKSEWHNWSWYTKKLDDSEPKAGAGAMLDIYLVEDGGPHLELKVEDAMGASKKMQKPPETKPDFDFPGGF